MTENDVRKILRESDDLALREAAWKGSKALGGVVASRVLELVNTRNEVARSLGYRDHYIMSMELSELNEERVFDIFDVLAKQTDPMWREWKADFDKRQSERFGISVEELRPWHCPDQFFQVAPPSDLDLDTYFANKNLEELTTRFYTAIGLPIDDVLKRSDLYEKPGKNQHAFCTDIDHEGDVRVLCNVRSTENWMCTMLHEFGHAVYDLYADYQLPHFLRGPAHTLSTEAIAELMGRFSKDGDWLRTYAGVSAEEVARVAEISAEENRVQLLVMTRWVLVMCHFEREMYRDPSQDLNSLWWDMVEKYQGVHRPDNRNEPDWASKLHLALAPVYYQNYLLGEMFASQLLRYLRTKVVNGDAPDALVTSPKVGQWLREKIFEPGSTRSWEDGLAFATGERLNPAYFAEQLRR